MLHIEAWEEDLYDHHSKSYLYLKLPILGMNFQLFFACQYEAVRSPAKRVLETFQFSRLTSVHTCNQNLFPLSPPWRMELSLVDKLQGLRPST